MSATNVKESQLGTLPLASLSVNDFVRIVTSGGNSRSVLLSVLSSKICPSTNLAQTYSSSGTYAVGDLAVYDGTLYKCISAITSGESFVPSHWQAASLSSVISALDGDLETIEKLQKLLSDVIPGTTQTYTFTDGSVSQVLHKQGATTIRTDAFTYATNTITETRTINTGEVLTIVTNLTTLETTVTLS